jgi:1-aminocyclopropane-1-carboxylate deaminase
MQEEIIRTDKIFTQSITHKNGSQLDILRFDQVHPVVSGNKYFKLKYYLQEALEQKATEIVTFGGAYSNHIVATAFVCKAMGLKSTGIIRGEKPVTLSHTLQDSLNYGMDLIFTDRTAYRDKQALKDQYFQDHQYWIPEGGYGITGAIGAAEMLKGIDGSYTHIIAATGTGTMMAGFIKAAQPHQQIIGINIMKGNEQLIHEVEALLTVEEKEKNYVLLNSYHFGGYAKHSADLFRFINSLWHDYAIPTDFVYNGKSLFAVFDLLEKNYFKKGSKILTIQCGGLQGNLSLAGHVLDF